MSGEVPVAAGLERVNLVGGGHVMVRKLRRSEKGACLRHAGVTGQNELGAWAKDQELKVRMAIVSGEGLSLDGAAVEVKRTSHAGLGLLVGVEVYDAIETEDVHAVLRVAAPEDVRTDAPAEDDAEKN